MFKQLFLMKSKKKLNFQNNELLFELISFKWTETIQQWLMAKRETEILGLDSDA